MEPLEILLVGALLYVAWNSGALSPLGIAAPTPASPSLPPAGAQPMAQVGGASVPPIRATVTTPGQTTSANTTPILISGAGSVAAAAMSAPASFAALGLTGAAAGAAVAGIGVVVAIGAALYMAHVQRQKQATDENSAMNLGVAGVDSDLRTVNQAFNSHQISPTDAINLVMQIRANFWALVTPHIQPGRNGCSGGSACPPWPAGGNGCSGDIGAACCVGCYDLEGQDTPDQSLGYIGFRGHIAVLRMGGGTVTMQAVIGSKYGGKSRPQYQVVWQHQ